jgi:hypothetical protein
VWTCRNLGVVILNSFALVFRYALADSVDWELRRSA